MAILWLERSVQRLMPVLLVGLAFQGAAPIRPSIAGSQTAVADLVVDFGNGQALARRVELTENLDGLELLSRSGLAIEHHQGTVCAINGLGCPASDCFCACRSLADCRYWSYFHLADEGHWQAAEEGPRDYMVSAGSVDGWSWGEGSVTPPLPAPAALRAALLGWAWLEEQASRDGVLLSEPGFTADAVLAGRSVGQLGAKAEAGERLVNALATSAAQYAARGAAQAGKLTAAVAAADLDPLAFAGNDLVARIWANYDAASGRFGPTQWDQAWAMLGLVAAGEPVPRSAIEALASSQRPSGGWGYLPTSEADPDTTGLVMQALAAAGASRESVTPALGYLRAAQGADGGWGYSADASNVNSTALVVQGLLAWAEDPLAKPWQRAPGVDPLRYLVAQQFPSGQFEHLSPPASVIATLQTVPAVAGVPFPLASRPVAARKSLRWLLAQRGPGGGFLGQTASTAIEAILALSVWEQRLDQPGPDGTTLAEYLARLAPDVVAEGVVASGQLACAAAAAGANPGDLGGIDLAAALKAALQPTTGAFGNGSASESAWSILGLLALGEEVPPVALDYLIGLALPQGGWTDRPGTSLADTGTTSVVLQALTAAGLGTDALVLRRAVAALRQAQRPNGGFAERPGERATLEATASALLGLAAVGQDVAGPTWQQTDASGRRRGPIDALLAAQWGDGWPAGPLASPTDGQIDLAATARALRGLALRPLRLTRQDVRWRAFLPRLSLAGIP